MKSDRCKKTQLSADERVLLANTAVAGDRAKVITGNSNLRKPQEGRRRKATSGDISAQKKKNPWFSFIVKVNGWRRMHDLPLAVYQRYNEINIVVCC